MKGYLVYFTWDWKGSWYGLCPTDREQESCYWVPFSKYTTHHLNVTIAWLTGGNTWVKTDEGEYPLVEKRRVHIFSYSVEEVDLCKKTTQ